MSNRPNTRRRRIIPKPVGANKTEGRVLTAYERQTIVATNFIMNHSQYPTIIAMMRLGTSNSDIADFFIERGEFQINRKTAIAYLSMFRRAHPELCKLMDPNQSDGIVAYDHLFDGNAAILTSETELAKLIALQKVRISIDFASERNIGKLFNTTHKEVQVLGELIEKYARLRMGKTLNTAAGVGAVPDHEIRDGVQNIQHDEEKRAALTNAIFQLMQSQEP
jgi:hypothetical protein